MRILIIVGFLLTILMAFTKPRIDFNSDSPDGILFHKGTFAEALQAAEKDNRLVFLDIYATWCGPCKKMKSKTFADKDVGKFYNDAFINVALDGEQGEGIEIARKYGIRSYPTLLFLNSKGEIVAAIAGYHNPQEFIELGKKVIKKHK